MRRASLLVSLLAASLAGCGKGNFFAEIPATAVPPITGYASYHAYGDSITAGVGVPNLSFVYASLVAFYNSLPLSDYAYSGDEACDLAPRQIFPNHDSPTLATKSLLSMLIGTNDADLRGTGAGESIFNLCHQAAISWLATPLEDKVLATATAVTVSGPSHLETLDGFNAVTTDGANASITFAFARTTAAPLYLWYRISDSISSSFSCALDGAAMPVISTLASPAIATQNGSHDSVGVYRISFVPVGQHTLRCTQNASVASGMGLIAIGGPPPAATANRPRLMAGLLTPQINGGNSSALAAYRADVQANVALFAGDGLDIELFDAAKYMTGTSADFRDYLHPNALGQQEIFLGFEQALQ